MKTYKVTDREKFNSTVRSIDVSVGDSGSGTVWIYTTLDKKITLSGEHGDHDYEADYGFILCEKEQTKVEMAEAIKIFPEAAAGIHWDDVEVQPVAEYKTGDNGFCEVCEEGKQSFFSVYIHNIHGGVSCVADCKDKEVAKALAELLMMTANQFHSS